jgi:hypothetical protein
MRKLTFGLGNRERARKSSDDEGGEGEESELHFFLRVSGKTRSRKSVTVGVDRRQMKAMK